MVIASSIAEFIGKRSMIGTNYDITPYTPQPIDIEAVVYINKDYDADEIVNNIRAYLEGVTFHYGELLFDDTIIKSDLESEIKETFDGIISLRINTPVDAIISPSAPQNVLTLGQITISTVIM